MDYVRVKPSHEVQRIVRRPARQDCGKMQTWGRTQETFCTFKSAQDHRSLHNFQLIVLIFNLIHFKISLRQNVDNLKVSESLQYALYS